LYVPDLSGLTRLRRPNGKGEIANLHIVPSWRLSSQTKYNVDFHSGEFVLRLALQDYIRFPLSNPV
jgi:hypothetical protein